MENHPFCSFELFYNVYGLRGVLAFTPKQLLTTVTGGQRRSHIINVSPELQDIVGFEEGAKLQEPFLNGLDHIDKMEKLKLVKITYKPLEEIVILDYMEYPLDTLVSLHGLPMLAGGMVPPLLWAEGILFIYQGMDQTDSVLDEMREKGRAYWISVLFARMPKYAPTVTSNDRKITVNVVDVSSNLVLRTAAKWLSERKS